MAFGPSYDISNLPISLSIWWWVALISNLIDWAIRVGKIHPPHGRYLPAVVTCTFPQLGDWNLDVGKKLYGICTI